MFFLYAICGYSAPPKAKLSYEDSVYISLNKKERISKLLVLPISDFYKSKDLEKAHSIISNQHVGGVIINNGNKEEVKNWIC